jgi:pristinamycin I synthase-3/4
MMLHNAGLKQTFRSGRFDGDILLFYAAKKEGEHSLPDTWRPHVTGNIEVHTIDCKHFEMTDAEPMREIGAILERRLKLATER